MSALSVEPLALFDAPVIPDPEPPDLASYNVILINISGGKDSQATLDVTVRAADAAGVRDRLVTVFCDLGDEDEWPGTRELTIEHAAHYGVRHEIVCREVAGPDGRRVQQTLSEYIEARGKWPDAQRRYCTSDTKRAPVHKLLTRLAAEQRDRGVTGPVRILNVMGMRAQESPFRARMQPFYVNRKPTGEGTVKQVWDWLPIHHWRLERVWQCIAEAGTRPHPVYSQGMPRLSCRFCVLASRSALIRAAHLDPEGAAKRAAMEERMGHRFRNDLSMADVIAAAASQKAVAVEDWSA